MAELAILEQKVLTGIIEKYVAPPENVARRMFKNKTHPFTSAEWDVLKGSRERAVPTLPNREAKIVAQLGVGKKTASFIYVREKKAFEPTTIRWLREPGQMAKANAEACVRREMKDLDNRLERLIESYCWEALQGEIAIDEVDVQATISMGMTPAHKGASITARWDHLTNSTYDADIIGDIFAWKQLIVKATGFAATDIYLDSTILEYVYRNAAIKGLFSEKHKWQYLQTSTIEGLLGLDWHRFDGGYENTESEFIPYIKGGFIVMMAKAGNPCILLEGLSADFDAPKNKTGKFAKSWETKDPSARFGLIELNFMPILQRPDNVVTAQVVPVLPL